MIPHAIRAYLAFKANTIAPVDHHPLLTVSEHASVQASNIFLFLSTDNRNSIRDKLLDANVHGCDFPHRHSVLLGTAYLRANVATTHENRVGGSGTGHLTFQ